MSLTAAVLGGTPVEFVDRGSDRLLLLSMRRVADLVGYCALYEFEDLVSEVARADMVSPTGMEALEASRRILSDAAGADPVSPHGRAVHPPTGRSYDQERI